MSNLRIQELRESASMSKAELGRRAGITERTIRNIEQGVYEPSLKTCRKLAAALNVPFDDLFASAKAQR